METVEKRLSRWKRPVGWMQDAPCLRSALNILCTKTNDCFQWQTVDNTQTYRYLSVHGLAMIISLALGLKSYCKDRIVSVCVCVCRERERVRKQSITAWWVCCFTGCSDIWRPAEFTELENKVKVRGHFYALSNCPSAVNHMPCHDSHKLEWK